MQRHAQQQAHAGADEGQKLDLAEDVAVHFFVIEAQNLDSGKLLFALGKVDADQVVQHHRRQRRRAHDDQHHHVVQAADQAAEHGGGVLGEADAAHIVAAQQLCAQGVVLRLGGTAGQAVDGVPLRRSAQQGLQLRIGEIQPGEHVVLGNAGQGQLHTAPVCSLHIECIAHAQLQIQGRFFGQDHAVLFKGNGVVAHPGAEGEVFGHPGIVLRAYDADIGAPALFIIKGGGLCVERAPAVDRTAAVQRVGKALLHGQRLFIAERDGEIVVGQLPGLLVHDGQDGILNAKTDQQQRRAACHAQHCHEEALFVAEQVAGCGLLGEAHVLPQRGDVLQKDALACHRGPGQQQSCSLFLQAGTAGVPCSKTDDGRADGYAGCRHAGVKVQRKGGHAEDHLVSIPDDEREHHKTDDHAHDAAQHAGAEGIEQILACDLCVGVTQSFQGAQLQAVLVHHAGHSSSGHQRRHQEEEHREHPCNGIHAVGILLKGDKAHGGAAVQHIPLAALDLAHLLLGIVQLGKAVGQLLFGIGLPALVLRAGIGQLLHAVVVLLPAFVQPGACRIKLGVGCGRAGGELQLTLQKLYLHLAQCCLCLSHQLLVGKAGRRDQPLCIHLALARVQLGLIAVQLAADVVVSILRLLQGIPQLGVLFIGRFRFVQRFLCVVQSRFGIAQQRVGHLFQVHQHLDLLQLILKFQQLFLAAHQLVRTALHGIRQGLFVGGKLRFARVQLGFGAVQLCLCIGQLLLCLRKLTVCFGFFVVVLGPGVGQLCTGVLDQLRPPGRALCAADGLYPCGCVIHCCLIRVRVIIIQAGIFHFEIARRIIIRGQAALRQEHNIIQLAVTGGAALLVRGKMLRVLHGAHYRELLPAHMFGVLRQGEHRARFHRVAVAHHMHHALVRGLRHPARQQHQTVHIFCRVGPGVGGQLLQAHHRRLALALPLGLHVLIFHRLHSLHAVHGGNGGNVLLRKAQRGQHPQVEHVLLHVVFLPGDAHAGRKTHQAGQHHHAQRYDAEQRDHAAQVVLHFPQDVFTITFQHSSHHSISCTGTGCSLT